MKRRACFFIKVEVTLQGKEYKALFRCDSNSFRNLMILFQFGNDQKETQRIKVSEVLQYDRHIINRRDKS